MADADQTPYQLTKRDLSLLKKDRTEHLAFDMKGAVEQVSDEVQKETAKRIISHLIVPPPVFLDAEMNTEDNIFDSFKKEIEFLMDKIEQQKQAIKEAAEKHKVLDYAMREL